MNQTANALVSLGIGSGDRVAVLVHEVMSIAEIYLALAKIGATLVALNPYWDDAVMTGVLDKADVQALISQRVDASRIADIRSQLAGNIRWLQLEADNLPDNTDCLALAQAKVNSDEPPLTGGGDDPLAFFFTSGTTGLPKAVVHTHNSCRSMGEIWYALPRNEQSVWGTGPIIWGIGFPCTIGAAWFVGMKVALEDDFGPAGLLEASKVQPISHLAVIPSFFTDLLANHSHADVDLSAIQAVLLGGEPLAENLLSKIKERLPQAHLYAFYGQTEAPYTCFGRLDDGSQASNMAGVARPTCAAQVLGPNGDAVIDIAGELAVTGPHVMREYYSEADKTAESLRDDWFFSGDLAIQDSLGRITVLGRREDAIVRDGQYIQPLQIEDAALGIAGISEAGAVGVDIGERNQAILLALTTTAELSVEEIMGQLQNTLPSTAMPDRVVIVDDLPHNNDNSGGKGKLLRRKIREDYAHLVTAQERPSQ